MSAKVLLIISVVFASCGQVLFKKGMLVMGTQNIPSNISSIIKVIIGIVFCPYIFAGLVLYISSTIFWLFALSKAPLNYVYPFTALGFILVMTASYFIFSETVPINRIIGLVVICTGFVIASFR